MLCWVGGLGVFVLAPCGRAGAGGQACRRASFWGPCGGPNFESRSVSPNCRWTYFVTLFLGRIPAPLLGPALGQGRAACGRRCVEALRNRCRSLRGGIGRIWWWLFGAGSGGVFCRKRVCALFRAERGGVGQACRRRRVRLRRHGWAGGCWAHCSRWWEGRAWCRHCAEVAGAGCALACAGAGAACQV